jgi:hypothetical protein
VEINVFYFQAYSIESDRMVQSKRRATLEAIQRLGPCFHPIHHSEVTIDSSAFDSDGFQKGPSAETFRSLNPPT